MFLIGNRETYPHVTIEQYRNVFNIKYITKNQFEWIRIVQVPNISKRGHFKISIEKTTTDNRIFKKNYGGILGYISNKKFIILDKNQENGTTLTIDGRHIKTQIKTLENGVSCFFSSLKEIINPKNISNFLKSI